MNWITLIGIISTSMFFVLGLCSIWSVSIIIDRWRFYKTYFDSKKSTALNSQQDSKLQNFLKTSNSLEICDRSFLIFWNAEKIVLEKGLNILGTIGSNAPFIGLLGTVLAVIKAFGALAEQQSDSSQVMAGISEALLHTALGLFVAIPAVVFYNLFVKKMSLIYTHFDQVRHSIVKEILGSNGR